MRGLNLRTTKDLREKLEKAAGASGRSLNAEVEARLEESISRDLTRDQYFRNSGGFELMGLFAFAVELVERQTGKSWHQDYVTKEAAKTAIAAIFDGCAPESGEIGEPLDHFPLKREIFDEILRGLVDWMKSRLAQQTPEVLDSGRAVPPQRK